MRFSLQRVAFSCFILSGAASVSYQTIWLRHAMTYFGVITPVSSAVLSVFMLGLALGTYLAGRISGRLSSRTALIFYASVEGAIGILALMVPAFFKEGYDLLLHSGTVQSQAYLLQSCLIITVILLPICTLIGATFPLLMQSLRNGDIHEKNFSFLYLANLCGALIGCMMPVVFIEMYGFARSLQITAALNMGAMLLALSALPGLPTAQNSEKSHTMAGNKLPLAVTGILFTFGFVTLGCEVVWIRTFMSVTGPTVYAFAFILAAYLISTALGTEMYRNRRARTDVYYAVIMCLPVCALLPVVASSLVWLSLLRGAAVLSIAPLCFCFGYLTPKLIDDSCGNDTRSASRAYMVNCVGCIAGPVFSTYILFPIAGIKESLIAYALLLLPVAYWLLRGVAATRRTITFALFAVFLIISLNMQDMESAILSFGVLHRDHIGYIGATGKNMEKRLFVNGIGMTILTTITKNMAHLPLLHHPGAKSALVICFGMGTTVRSLSTWPLENITAVELSKGVIESFGYFYANAAQVLSDPRVHVINDDGRRFLNRSHEQYDVIIIDPPPPIPAAGSGLLYTTEFLAAVKSRLAPGGILQHWIPEYEYNTLFTNAALNAVHKKFKYVKLYAPIPIEWKGVYIMASDSPLPELTPEQFVHNLPPKAADDLKEWMPGISLEES